MKPAEIMDAWWGLRNAQDFLRPHGLSIAQAMMLFAIVDGPIAMTEMVRYLGLAQSTVSRLKTPLIRSGLVATRPDNGDKRIVVIGLTDAGFALVLQISGPPTTVQDPEPQQMELNEST